MKKVLLFFLLFFQSFGLYSKNIIFDLGDVVVRQSRFTFAWNVGISQFIAYSLFDFQNPKYIKDIAFDVLDHIYLQEVDNDLPATYADRPLPGPICSWLAGMLMPKNLINDLQEKIEELDKDRYFISDREKKLVGDVLNNMFDPHALTECTTIIPEALTLIKELVSSGDHDLYILSNWDPTSFELLKKRPDMQILFNLFGQDRIFISGDHGTIKPYKTIYEIFLDTYKLDANECIFIDDQKNNILGAKKTGIAGIQFFGDYNKLKKELSTNL